MDRRPLRHIGHLHVYRLHASPTCPPISAQKDQVIYMAKYQTSKLKTPPKKTPLTQNQAREISYLTTKNTISLLESHIAEGRFPEHHDEYREEIKSLKRANAVFENEFGGKEPSVKFVPGIGWTSVNTPGKSWGTRNL